MTAKLIVRRKEVPINRREKTKRKKNGELQTHNGVCTYKNLIVHLQE